VSVGSDAAPDYAEPLRAWRVWRVVERERELFLGSVVKPTVWPVRRALEAVCLRSAFRVPWRRAHDAPQETCDCGIYGSSLERAADYARQPLPLRALGWAVGLVSLWGTVVECEHGYRASHAYPAELWIPWPADGARIDRVAVAACLAAYGSPVRLLEGYAHEAPELLAHETVAAQI
jgi:hypothetical protein